MTRQWPIWIFGAVTLNLLAYRAIWHQERERRTLRHTAKMLSRRNEQFSALSNVYNQIAENMGFQEVVNASLSEITKLMGADMVSLRRLEGEWLMSAGAILRDGSPMKLATAMRVGEGLTGRAISERRTIRVARDAEVSMSLVSTVGKGDLSPSEQSGAARLESGIIAPLVVGSRIFGALAVWSKEIGHFTAEDESVFEMMASQVATAMVAASMMDERDRLAHIDALTGLPNRLQLNEDLSGELASLAEMDRCAVFAMVDIDHFKDFNDQFGHGAGDLVLQNIGAVMRTSIRPSDNVYRYGGEEFLVVFMNAGRAEGHQLAERLRRAIGFQLSENQRVTVSIGLASLPQDGTAPHGLIDLADSAMYRAKKGGRDRTVTWETMAEEDPQAAA